MFKKCLSLAAVIFAVSMSAHAQEIPKYEFAATYSLLVSDIDALDNEAMHGYGLSFQANVNRSFALVGEWTADHGSSGPVTFLAQPGRINLIPEVDTRVLVFLVGPRGTYRHNRTNLFGHWLFGVGNQKVEDEKTGFRTGNGEFAMSVGGGLDVYLGKQVSLRAAQFDYLPIHSDINARLSRPNDQGLSTFAGDSNWGITCGFKQGSCTGGESSNHKNVVCRSRRGVRQLRAQILS